MKRRVISLEQVGALLQAIYNTEAHLEISWMWDGGFDFAYGTRDYGYETHPKEVTEYYKEINSAKIEEVASLILLEFEINHSIVDSNGELNSAGEFIKMLNAQ